MLVLLSLASIDVRGRRHAQLVSIGDRPQQRGAAWAVLLSLRSFNLTLSSIETRPAAE